MVSILTNITLAVKCMGGGGPREPNILFSTYRQRKRRRQNNNIEYLHMLLKSSIASAGPLLEIVKSKGFPFSLISKPVSAFPIENTAAIWTEIKMQFENIIIEYFSFTNLNMGKGWAKNGHN